MRLVIFAAICLSFTACKFFEKKEEPVYPLDCGVVSASPDGMQVLMVCTLKEGAKNEQQVD